MVCRVTAPNSKGVEDILRLVRSKSYHRPAQLAKRHCQNIDYNMVERSKTGFQFVHSELEAFLMVVFAFDVRGVRKFRLYLIVGRLTFG